MCFACCNIKMKRIEGKGAIMNFVTPAGLRDVMPEEASRREQITTSVADLFAHHGYAPIETPTLERMDVLRAAGRIPPSPFKMFDTTGDLLALRPDVTMQVARMCATRLRGQEGPFRFRYTQRVFREPDQQASQRELTQIGLECIGAEGPAVDAEIIGLLVEALQTAGLDDFKIALGTVGVLRALLETCPAEGSWKNDVLAAYHASDFIELDRLIHLEGVPTAFAGAIAKLPFIRGGREAIEEARALAKPLGCARGLDDLAATYDELCANGFEGALLVDFSIMSSFDYYTGVVFEAYVPGMGTSLGSGGRYDGMLASYEGAPLPAGGFAFYLEQVMAALAKDRTEERPLRIAVPKGSLNADTIRALSDAGLDTAGLDDPGRQLIIGNPGVDFIIVRPTDAPVFVAMGAADCGICGRDSLVEADTDVVELVDLRYGGCKFVVAQPKGATPTVEKRYRKLGSIRVTTKYPNITKAYYDRIGQQVEVVQLHGNIELGPLIGMSDRIVDITATGTTLRENNLEVVDDVMGSTARFFANPCAFRMDERVLALSCSLKENVR